MNDAALDRAVECTRDTETEAAHTCQDGLVTAADDAPAIVYDADSWHSDCADFMVANTVQGNDRIREHLRTALRDYVDARHGQTDEFRLFCMRGASVALMHIGYEVMKNAMANGLTLDNVGEFTE